MRRLISFLTVLILIVVAGWVLTSIVDHTYFIYAPGSSCQTGTNNPDGNSVCLAEESPLRSYGWPYISRIVVEGHFLSPVAKVSLEQSLNDPSSLQATVPLLNYTLPFSAFTGDWIFYSGVLVLLLLLFIFIGRLHTKQSIV